MHFQVAGAVAILLSALAAASPVELVTRDGTGAPSIDDPKFQQAVLDNHNWYRAFHHADNLKWDDKLAQFAQDRVNQCQFEHDPVGLPHLL